MKNIWTIIELGAAGVGGFLGWALGGIDGALTALIFLSFIDYLTGLSAAYIRRELSSRVGFNGIMRKILIYAIVAVGTVIDRYILHDAAGLRTAIIFFYVANELLSIVENAGVIGLPVPRRLCDAIKVIKSENDGGAADTAGENNTELK